MFVGREQELQYLDDCYNSDKFEFIVMYGRRRVGKTTLLTEFSKDKKVIYHMAEETSLNLQIEALAKAVFMTFEKPAFLGGLNNYEEIIDYVVEKAGDERLLLIIDEFPYLAGNDKGLLSKLQKWIDLKLKETKIMLILCGSSISFMENKVLAYKSPIFGRKTGQIEVKPFDFYQSRAFFDGYSLEEQVMAYGIIGGIPLYLELWDSSKNIKVNVKKIFLGKFGYLYEEPQNLLKQELREPTLYASIIGAIAGGASKLNEISTKIGAPYDKTGVYLKTLMLLRLVRRVKPIYEKESKRKTLYQISDQLFKFVYRFVYPNRLLIEQHKAEHIFDDKILPDLNHFIGPVFEEVCNHYLLRESADDKLDFYITEIGKWWGTNPKTRQQEEIDLVARGDGHVIIAECKWRGIKTDVDVFETLIRRGELLKTNDQIHYCIFSKSGFQTKLVEAVKDKSNVSLIALADMD